MLVFIARKSNWLPLLFTCLALLQAPVFANNCTSAVPLPFTTWPVVTFGTATFSVATALGSPPACNLSTTVLGWAWFQFDPGTPGTQHDLRVEFTSSAAGTFRYYVFSSETKDSGSGSPCDWPSGGNGNRLNERWDGCFTLNGTPGDFHAFATGGIDGSGTFFVVVEKMTGSAVSINASTQTIATGTAPANDRCINTTTMTIGNGIDTNTGTGGSGLWSNGIAGTTQYATKQRMLNSCVGARTEDHFWTNTILNPCFINRPISYNAASATNITYTDNSVWYNFVIPAGGPTNNWYLKVGDMDCPYEPNTMEVLILSNVSCTNAQNANRISVNNSVSKSFAFPTPDANIGPFTLAQGTTYTIYVDGVRGSQCNFTLLLTRTVANPVLPAELLSFEGKSLPGNNHLTWETASEIQLSGFAVERALTPGEFEEIGWVASTGSDLEGATYAFDDLSAPLGPMSYRLRTVDIDGAEAYSQTVELTQIQHQSGLQRAFFGEDASLQLGLSVAETGFSRLACLDIQGKIVGTWSGNLDAGMHGISLDATRWAPGLYVVQWMHNGYMQSVKVVKP